MNQTLKVSTPTDTEIVMTRDFDAPRALVWEAMSRPDLLKRWLLGPPGWTMVLCEHDVRAGGAFRFEWRDSQGAKLAMHGVYREVVPPVRAVRTELMEFEVGGVPRTAEQLTTMVLAEQGGRTSLTLTVTLPSKEVRDAALASGMEHGVAASYDRLAVLLASKN